MDLRSLQSDPVAFRQVLLIDADISPRRLWESADPWQRDDYLAMDQGWKQVAGCGDGPAKFQRFYLERGRGHSKTCDLSVMAAWVLLASRRRLSGYAAAADKDQARLLRDGVAKLVALNPWLSSVLEVQAYKVVNRHTDSTLEILSSDAASSFGVTPDFVLIDELTCWHSRELWDSLISAAAKRSRCLVCVISNAGFRTHWSWEVREACRQDEDWYFHSLPGCVASWLSPKLLREQRRLLPALAYSRLWGNEWVDSSGDAFEGSDVDDSVTLDGPAGPAPGMIFVAGLDLGISRDASGLIILGKSVGHYERRPRPKRRLSGIQSALSDLGYIDSPATSEWDHTFHPGDGRLKLAECHVWRPENGSKVRIEDVERKLLEVRDKFKLAGLAADNWQAAYLLERLAKQGLPVEPVHFGGGVLQEMATETLDVFRDRRIDLYREPTLLADLKNLRVAQRNYGFRLESPTQSTSDDGSATRHGDTATALSLALHAARRIRTSTGGTTQGRSLVLN